MKSRIHLRIINWSLQSVTLLCTKDMIGRGTSCPQYLAAIKTASCVSVTLQFIIVTASGLGINESLISSLFQVNRKHRVANKSLSYPFLLFFLTLTPGSATRLLKIDPPIMTSTKILGFNEEIIKIIALRLAKQFTL